MTSHIPELTADVKVWRPGFSLRDCHMYVHFNVVIAEGMELNMRYSRYFSCPATHWELKRIDEWNDLTLAIIRPQDYVESFTLCFAGGHNDQIKFDKDNVIFMIGNSQIPITGGMFKYPRQLCGPVFQSIVDEIKRMRDEEI